MREIKFRAWDTQLKGYQYSGYGEKTFAIFAKRTNCGRFIIEQFTGYEMFNKRVFEHDLVSNNYKTDKEVIREIIMHGGMWMMKRIKGTSNLQYMLLHEFHNLNYKIIGNIHEEMG